MRLAFCRYLMVQLGSRGDNGQGLVRERCEAAPDAITRLGKEEGCLAVAKRPESLEKNNRIN